MRFFLKTLGVAVVAGVVVIVWHSVTSMDADEQINAMISCASSASVALDRRYTEGPAHHVRIRYGVAERLGAMQEVQIVASVNGEPDINIGCTEVGGELQYLTVGFELLRSPTD